MIFLLAGAREAWRSTPDWSRGSLLGGIAYLLVQLKLNGFSGGTNFYGYRLPLGTITLALPFLVLAWNAPALRERSRQLAIVVCLGYQATLMALGAFLSVPLSPFDETWTEWKPSLLLRDQTASALPILCVGAFATAACYFVIARWPRVRTGKGPSLSAAAPSSAARR